MAKTSLLTTGLNGLVGSKLAQVYADQYDFSNLDISHPTQPTDITNYDQVLAAFENSPAEWVVHFAAFTDVTAAWQQTGDKNGPAYKVNVVGTQNIVKAAEITHKKIIHLSTAFVFDGKKTDLYTESDTPQPIEWYGQTKLEAEQVVQNSQSPWCILRIDFPFRSDAFPRPDIVRKTVANIDKGYPLFTDHHFGPTYIDDFVKVIDWVIRTNQTGLFHASNGESWTDFDFATAIVKAQQLRKEIKSGSLAEYLKTTNRPYQQNTALDCSKLIKAIDFALTPINEALTKVQL
jgi:dTDP-4-dehydrorhamnose reductase